MEGNYIWNSSFLSRPSLKHINCDYLGVKQIDAIYLEQETFKKRPQEIYFGTGNIWKEEIADNNLEI